MNSGEKGEFTIETKGEGDLDGQTLYDTIGVAEDIYKSLKPEDDVEKRTREAIEYAEKHQSEFAEKYPEQYPEQQINIPVEHSEISTEPEPISSENLFESFSNKAKRIPEKIRETSFNLLKNLPERAKKAFGVAAFAALCSLAAAGCAQNTGNADGGQETEAGGEGQSPETETPPATPETEASIANVLTGYEELDSLIDGSFQQHNNPGCYRDENKVTRDSVGNPRAVLEMIGVDNPEEATAEQMGAVMEYYAYSMDEVAASVAILARFDGFEGLSQSEGEEQIRGMTQEEKAELQERIRDYFSDTEWSFIEGVGNYRNMYIGEDEENETHAGFVESDLTGKRILISEKTLENGGKLTIRFKTDCGNIEIEAEVTAPDGTTTTVTIAIPAVQPASHQNTSTQETTTETTPQEQETHEETTTETEDPGKSTSNTLRIDGDALDDIARDINTGQVVVTPTPSTVVESQPVTPPTEDQAYEQPATPFVDRGNFSAPPEEEVGGSLDYHVDQGRANPLPPGAVDPHPESDEEADQRGDREAGADEISSLLGGILEEKN